MDTYLKQHKSNGTFGRQDTAHTVRGSSESTQQSNTTTNNKKWYIQEDEYYGCTRAAKCKGKKHKVRKDCSEGKWFIWVSERGDGGESLLWNYM